MQTRRLALSAGMIAGTPRHRPVLFAVRSMYPQTRLRRLRMHPRLRDLVRETRLAPSDFILPLFVRPGKSQRIPIKSMPGQFQLSVDQLAGEIREIDSLGIPSIILFGIPDHKDAHGTGAYSD